MARGASDISRTTTHTVSGLGQRLTDQHEYTLVRRLYDVLHKFQYVEVNSFVHETPTDNQCTVPKAFPITV
jgi:hypothetical protein